MADNYGPRILRNLQISSWDGNAICGEVDSPGACDVVNKVLKGPLASGIVLGSICHTGQHRKTTVRNFLHTT